MLKNLKMAKTRVVIKVILTIVAFVVLLASLILNFLANVPSGVEGGNSTFNGAPGLFRGDTECYRDKYPSSISPASWAFVIIWPLIFLWNLIGVSYMVVSLFFSNDQSPVKREPALIPIPTLILWSLTFSALVGWTVSYDREYFGLALFFIILAPFSAYACLGFSYRSYFQDILILEEYNGKMLWLVRILFHNGFAVLATWLTCAWKLNFATVITYVDSRNIDKEPADLRSSLTSEDCGTIALSILLFEIAVWFILENMVFERYCRYTLTIYPVLIYTFTAIFVDNFVIMTQGPIIFPRNQAIVLAGIALTSVLFVARIVLVVLRHRKRFQYA